MRRWRGTTILAVRRGERVALLSENRYEWAITSAAGMPTPWATVTGMRVRITAADIGGVLYLRSCDAVGNCSAPVALRIQAASGEVVIPAMQTRREATRMKVST